MATARSSTFVTSTSRPTKPRRVTPKAGSTTSRGWRSLRPVAIPVATATSTRTDLGYPHEQGDHDMAKYLLAYKGGHMAETPEAQAAAMAAWGAWFGGLGAAVSDPGNPFGPSASLAANGSASDGGA